jgi:predicted ATPase/DNA-binding SARP family transcriptional activator
MARCSISLLGTMQFALDGSPMNGLESVKVRALLAYLAVENAQPHERERLAGLFWPEMSEAQARHSLSQALYNLRQALGQASKTGDLSGQPGSEAPFLLLTPHTVQFNPYSDSWLDVREFEQVIFAVRRHDHRRLETCGQCAKLLQVAEQLYQGDFLAGVSLRGCQAFEEWALVRRERLHLRMGEALSDLVNYYDGRAEIRRALEIAQRWVHLDPLSEPAQRGLMRLLALDGQRTQALAGFAGFAKMLRTELGVVPERETQRLYQRILDEETTQTSLPGMAGRLPVPLTPFVGREDELAELAAWVRDPQTRLVTVLGPGGSGKTRLALQAAHALRYDFPDGIFMVSLSGTGSSEAFLPALASVLGVTFQRDWGDQFAQLLGYLQHRRLLLILDSFEEVPEACTWVTRLLQGAAALQILVTSRARLNVQAEQAFLLEGLEYPDPASPATLAVNIADYSALQLFHNTASQVNPEHPHAPTDLPHLARICQLVAGMPLGIMLAATWMATCSPAEIAAEIEHSLDFLASSWSDMPYRQRSLRATLDHSWSLLGDEERRAFTKLSVFQSAFNRQAAAQVAQVSDAGLRGLVDKSMLQVSAGSYRMHDLLRQYGAEKLPAEAAQAGQVRDAHSAWYLEHLAGYEARLKSAQRSTMLQEMDAEINDLQAAWGWACRQGYSPLLERSLSGICLYYEMRVRYPEGERACQAGLAAVPEGAGDAEVLRARLLVWRASFLVLSGELEAARSLRQEAGELLDQLEAQSVDTRRPRAMYWQAEGEAQAEMKAKLACYQRGIALYEELGDTWRQAGMLVWAGEFAMRLGEPGLALQYQQEALRLARQAGEPGLLLHCLRQSTYLYSALNQFENFHRLMQETVSVLESVEELPLRATAQMHLGMQFNHIGHFPEAIRLLEQSVPVLRSLGYHYGMVYGGFALGLGYTMNGEYERGAAILQTTLQEGDQWGVLREATTALHALGMVAVVQGRLIDALNYFSQVVQRYRSMQFAGELGMAFSGLALAHCAAGQAEAARDNLREALLIVEKTHNMAAVYMGWPAVVLYFVRYRPLEKALLMHRLASRIPFLHNSRWYADIIGSEMEAKWQALSPEQQEAIDASAKGHTPFSIIPQVLEMLE